MIKLQLTEEEVNGLLTLLSEFPYKQVAGIMMKIQQQGQAQLSEMKVEKPESVLEEEK